MNSGVFDKTSEYSGHFEGRHDRGEGIKFFDSRPRSAAFHSTNERAQRIFTEERSKAINRSQIVRLFDKY